MQSKVIDINTAVMTYRSALMRAIYDENKLGSITCIKALNNLLPAERRFIFDSLEYETERKSKKIVKCKKCKNNIDIENRIKQEAVYSEYSSMVLVTKYITCDKCENKQSVHSGDIDDMHVMTKKLHFLPDIQTMSSVFENSLRQGEFWKNISLCQIELEKRHTDYRHELPRQDDEGEDLA